MLGRRVIKVGISSLVWLLDSLHNTACSLVGTRLLPARSVVLYYHDVTEAKRERFGKQMDLLLRLGTIISISGLEHNSVTENQYRIMVTFDDGFVSFAENALPEITMRKIPVTVFVPTGSFGKTPSWINSDESPVHNERVMSVGILKQLTSNPFITIGSHSVSHTNFLKLDEETALRELTHSKEELEQITGRSVDVFSFPHGAYNARSVELAKQAGYRLVFTIDPCLAYPREDRYVIGRFHTSPDDWTLELFLKARGAYRWMALWNLVKNRKDRNDLSLIQC